MSFEEAKQFLRREDESGKSLYEHLSRVLTKIIVEKPANANALFEQISKELRGSESYAAPREPAAEGDVEAKRPGKEAQLGWCAMMEALYQEKEDGEGTFPDLLTEANVFEWAGIGFGRSETYRLYLSIKTKALEEGLRLRFWGKVLGQRADYYVAQSDHPSPPEDAKAVEGAEGVNKYAFWICHHAGGPWTRLPDATPEAILCARKIKRFLTGDLESSVPSYPPFPGGTEAHLLRAQIALITAECAISPDGFYVEDDEAAEGIKALKKNEEIEEFKSMEDLKDPANWKHHELPINVDGRCNRPPADDDAEDDAQPADELPELPLLASAADDDPAWRIEACPGGSGESPDSIVVAKSLKWPGAVAAAFGNKFLTVYCGFGYSSNRGVPYQPPSINPIMPEWTPNQEEDEPDLVEDADKITAPVVEKDEDEEDA